MSDESTQNTPVVPEGMEKLPPVQPPPPPHKETPSMWTREAMTMFCRGMARGLLPALTGAGIGGATTTTTDAGSIAINAAIGFMGGLIYKGIERFDAWVKKDENELPVLSAEPVKIIALILLVIMLALKLTAIFL